MLAFIQRSMESRGILRVSLVPAVAATTAILLLTSGCERPAPPEIRIGVLASLSNINPETSGRPTVEGAQLAADEANASGGVSIDGEPHRVTLVIKDDGSRAETSTAAARALINLDAVDALVGPQISMMAIPVSGVAETAAVPMISPMSSAAATTEGKRFVFRLAFLDSFQGEVLGRFATEEMRARTAAVLFDVANPYSRALAARFRESFESRGGRVVAYETYTTDAGESFERQAARIRAVSPDILFLPNDTAFVRAQLRDLKAAGVDAPILGTDGWDPRAIAQIPESDGAFVSHQWHPDIDLPETRAFVARYRETYGKTPKSTAAMTYDAVRILLDAATRGGGKTPEAIRRGLLSTKDYHGATGVITFDGSNDPSRSVVINRLSQGRVELYTRIDPATPRYRRPES